MLFIVDQRVNYLFYFIVVFRAHGIKPKEKPVIFCLFKFACKFNLRKVCFSLYPRVGNGEIKIRFRFVEKIRKMNIDKKKASAHARARTRLQMRGTCLAVPISSAPTERFLGKNFLFDTISRLWNVNAYTRQRCVIFTFFFLISKTGFVFFVYIETIVYYLLSPLHRTRKCLTL